MPGAVRTPEDLLEKAPKIATVLSFAILTLSATHEWGYFQVVGMQFFPLMTPTDYVISAVFWLPWVAGGWIIAQILKVGSRRLSNFENADDDSLGNTVYVRADRVRKSKLLILAFLIWTAGLAIYEFFYVSHTHQLTLFMTVSGVWLVYLLWVMSHEKMADRITRMQLYAVSVVPAVLLSIFWLGQMEGNGALISYGDIYVMKFKNEGGERPLPVLRNLSRGVLVRDSRTNRIAFHKWNDIAEFSIMTRGPMSTLGCRLVGYYCERPLPP